LKHYICRIGCRNIIIFAGSNLDKFGARNGNISGGSFADGNEAGSYYIVRVRDRAGIFDRVIEAGRHVCGKEFDTKVI